VAANLQANIVERRESVDRDDIVNSINLYSLAVDTLCWDLFDGIFLPDGEVDYHTVMLWSDRESFKRDFVDIHGALDGSNHLMVNHHEGSSLNRAARTLPALPAPTMM
jgi:hypothetical protein